MPIYEFYCYKCHAIYSFFSRRVDTERSPGCPKCGLKSLDRQVSRFAFSTGQSSSESNDDGPGLDDPKMERAMMELASDLEHADENDPRAMAHMMRKMVDVTGMPKNAGIEEAIRRLEAGEDPDRLEEEMGDMFDELDMTDGLPSSEGLQRGAKLPTLQSRQRSSQPRVDPQLYDMD
jgi:putative FmdB family regulatory protein